MTADSPKSTTSDRVIPEEVRRHFETARREMRAGFQALLPPEVLNHGRLARREILLAWRAMIDRALERTEEAHRPAK